MPFCRALASSRDKRFPKKQSEKEKTEGKQKEKGKGKKVGDHERGGNSRREGKERQKKGNERRKERKKKNAREGKKEVEETKEKSGEPAGRNELEVNQTYRSYRSRYHYHLPNYYLPAGLYLDSASSLPYPIHRMHRVPE